MPFIHTTNTRNGLAGPQALGALLVALACLSATAGRAFEIVKDGKPVAVIVSNVPAAATDKPKGKAKGQKKANDDAGSGQMEAAAVKLLQEWVQKISDVELSVRSEPGAGPGPAIFVGKAAEAAGLKLDDIVSPTHEGARIVVEENRVLIGGQNEAATFKATARFLEALGCRCFMDGPIGEVYPRTKNLALAAMTISEAPGLIMRNPKGPSWNQPMWKAWNGGGGETIGHAHSWGGYVKESLFAEHPEWFAMGWDGQRRASGWLCTSNPELRKYFAQQVIEAIKSGRRNPSLSPTDGRGYCRCPACVAQDDPKVIEESSGTVSMSKRYVDFFDDVGRQVAKVYPDSILSFYCYADYTQPPDLGGRKLSPNLCAFIAPIRYCRIHEIGHAECSSRVQEKEMIEGWAKLANRIGYYNYMYDLADGTLPMFKFTACKTEFPYLMEHNLSAMTIEILSNWYIYGPQIYLSLKMAYDPKADADAVMDDYFNKFYGPASGPMKEYWMGIDAAMEKCPSHAGSFFGLQEIYTPAFMRQCGERLARAAEAAKGDKNYSERVAMAGEGFKNVLEYQQIRALMAAGEFGKAKEALDAMESRIHGLENKGWANKEYGTSYLNRFLLKGVAKGAVVTAAPAKVLSVLPEKMRFQLDEENKGAEKGYAASDFDDSKWPLVSTYDQTLSSQGFDKHAVLWYRTAIDVPKEHGKLSLFFAEIDGFTDVFVNGKRVAVEPPAPPPAPKGKGKAQGNAADHDGQGRPRAPFEVSIDEAIQPGKNVLALKVDHTRMTDLSLGGILRPGVLVEK